MSNLNKSVGKTRRYYTCSACWRDKAHRWIVFEGGHTTLLFGMGDPGFLTMRASNWGGRPLVARAGAVVPFCGGSLRCSDAPDKLPCRTCSIDSPIVELEREEEERGEGEESFSIRTRDSLIFPKPEDGCMRNSSPSPCDGQIMFSSSAS